MLSSEYLRMSPGHPRSIYGAMIDILGESKVSFGYNDDGTILDRLETLKSKFPLSLSIITNNYYRKACDVLINGGSLISNGFQLTTNIRDCCGFCIPMSLDSSEVYYRGFTDNDLRPGILIQKTVNIDLPRGNVRCTLPSKTKVTLPEGSYLVDAEVFDKIMTDQSLYAIYPSG